MGAPVVVDLEPCLDPRGLDCCGDSVALEVLAHHRCLSAQAGSGVSTVGLRQGTVGAQLATKQSLTANGTHNDWLTIEFLCSTGNQRTPIQSCASWRSPDDSSTIPMKPLIVVAALHGLFVLPGAPARSAPLTPQQIAMYRQCRSANTQRSEEFAHRLCGCAVQAYEAGLDGPAAMKQCTAFASGN